PRFAQHCWVDAVREIAELDDGLLNLVPCGPEELRHLRRGIGLGGPLGKAKVVREREQLLLSTVVQVTLETAPLHIAPLDDPDARSAEFLELRPYLGLQLLVLDGEPRRRENLLK